MHRQRPVAVLGAWCVVLLLGGLAAVVTTAPSQPSSLNTGAGSGASSRPGETRSAASATGASSSSDLTTDGPALPSSSGTVATGGSTGVANESSDGLGNAAERGPGAAAGAPVGAPNEAPELPPLAVPPTPDASHVVFYGRALDDHGQPVVDGCVTLTMLFNFGPAPTARTMSDGSYLVTAALNDPHGILYDIGAATCVDHPQDLLGGIADPARSGASVAEGGTVHRTDFVLPRAPTVIDGALVDPVGRPITGTCVRTTARVTIPVDYLGRFQVVRPGMADMTLYMDGVCGVYLGYDATYATASFALTAGHNDITFVVPWNANDSFASRENLILTRAKIDTVATSFEASEPGPSCAATMTGSWWGNLATSPTPGAPVLSVTAGGFLHATLSSPAVIAVYAGDELGSLREVACGSSTDAVRIPPGYDRLQVQVVATSTLATAGTLSFSYG